MLKSHLDMGRCKCRTGGKAGYGAGKVAPVGMADVIGGIGGLKLANSECHVIRGAVSSQGTFKKVTLTKAPICHP
jgi:hypothetical protein